MSTAEEHLTAWLRDAHAMEEQAETVFRAEANRIRNFPEFEQAIEAALRRVTEHIKAIETCIERRGKRPSAMKDALGKIVAFGQGISGVFVGDEVIKAVLAIYTFQHMRLGSYAILAETARQCGDRETERVSGEIAAEEKVMAGWLEHAIPDLVARYLQREETPGVTAKH